MNDNASTTPRSSRARLRWLWVWLKRAAAASFVAGLFALIIVAWLPKPVPVDMVEVRRGALRVTVDEDGRTRVQDRFIISAPLSGNLDRIELNPGDPVAEEQVLARLVPLARPLMDTNTRIEARARADSAEASQRQAQAATARARAALNFQEREVERQRRLARQGSTPPSVLESVELQLRTRRQELASARFGERVAKHQHRMARAALGRFGRRGSGEEMEVRSPVAGCVLRLLQESGGVVQAGAPIMEIGDASHLELVVDVLTSDAVHIAPGARVIVERWGGEHPLDAHVRRVEPSAFTRVSALGVEEQRVNVLIDLDSPRDQWQRLGDGYRVETRIVIWEEADVLLVPAGAVFRHREGWAAYRASDRATLTPIRVGRRNGISVQVLDGLDEGDQVIAHPSDRVVDGVEVVRR